ncbi:D-amino acid dehydrogenase small subunit [Pseudoroseomonas deserti]|uniref:D-amino acid dehydrogenase small subunit n=2 Tax=Teichococcus deserti TaxID=1817963 RepID=A0A1V2GYT3_9PROT|nr:D-amino acid dehydrogenase small subunit [Pseudoroseomonas deserti]
MHICVLGGGVIGVTTAWSLARRGCQVTLLEAGPELARGASQANGAQLSYSYVAPLASPDTLRHLPAMLLQGEGALRFRPEFSPAQWRWCLSFLRACTGSRAARTTAELLALGAYSRQQLHALLAETPIDFDHSYSGKLVLYRDPAAFAVARAQMALQASLGSEQSALDRDACIALEPALAGFGGPLTGAIHTPSEETGDCRRFTEGLAALASERHGVRILTSQPARRLVREGGRIRAVETAGGAVEADGFVLATGTASGALMAPLGVALPVYPLRGYSLTAPITPKGPRLSITDLHHKIVFAPLGGRLRVAGMVDLGRAVDATESARLALLQRQARTALPEAADYDRAETWRGARPASPDSKPFIGATPYSNLWLNTGHGALGFTFAAGSAGLVADLVTGATPALPLDPFSLDRRWQMAPPLAQAA